MKILVINCSPRGNRSDTLKLTKAFLEGMNETAEIINAVDLNIKPCYGCYTCWRQTPGICMHHDDMPMMLEKITSADLVIFSTPLYCYSIPACGKAIFDRLMPLTCPEQKASDDGSTYHPTRQKNTTRFMLITSCGFPNFEHNFEALLMQFGMCFHAEKNYPRITCVEGPLLSIPEAQPVAIPYLELVKRAGAEFTENGNISEATQKLIDAPMLPAEEYRASI